MVGTVGGVVSGGKASLRGGLEALVQAEPTMANADEHAGENGKPKTEKAKNVYNNNKIILILYIVLIFIYLYKYTKSLSYFLIYTT